jgi:hypothetical protein
MKIILISFLILASGFSFAGNQVGTIQKLFVSGRDYAAPNQNPTHVSITGRYNVKPDCAISGYWAVNTDTAQGKAILSLLLTANATGKKVSFLGTGNCSLRPDMETLFQVGFENN